MDDIQTVSGFSFASGANTTVNNFGADNVHHHHYHFPINIDQHKESTVKINQGVESTNSLNTAQSSSSKHPWIKYSLMGLSHILSGIAGALIKAVTGCS